MNMYNRKFMRMLENDVQHDKSVIHLINKVDAVRSGSEHDAQNFNKYISQKYGIDDELSFSNVMKTMAKGSVVVGSGFGIVKSVQFAIENAIAFCNRFPILRNVNMIKGTATAYSYMYRLPLIIFACFIVFVLYKIISYITKNEVYESARYKKLKIKNMILESKLICNNVRLRALSQRSYMYMENDTGNDGSNEAIYIVKKAEPQCNSLFNKIFKSSYEFIEKYKGYITMALICIGIILAFIGINNGSYSLNQANVGVFDKLKSGSIKLKH